MELIRLWGITMKFSMGLEQPLLLKSKDSSEASGSTFSLARSVRSHLSMRPSGKLLELNLFWKAPTRSHDVLRTALCLFFSHLNGPTVFF